MISSVGLSAVERLGSSGPPGPSSFDKGCTFWGTLADIVFPKHAVYWLIFDSKVEEFGWSVIENEPSKNDGLGGLAVIPDGEIPCKLDETLRRSFRWWFGNG